MKTSLKEARRIERRIQEKGINKGCSLHARINIYTKPPVALDICDAEFKVEDDVINSIALIEARFKIRRLIQETNETSGINLLITMREESIKILNIWEKISAVGEEIKPVKIVQCSVEAKLARVKSGKEDYYSSHPDTVEFVAVSEKLYKIAVENVRDTQRKIDQCDDDLAGLNALTKVKISDDIVELLQSNNII